MENQDSDYYERTIQKQIRKLAYLLAEKDGFKETPEYYWVEAEIKLRYDFK